MSIRILTIHRINIYSNPDELQSRTQYNDQNFQRATSVISIVLFFIIEFRIISLHLDLNTSALNSHLHYEHQEHYDDKKIRISFQQAASNPKYFLFRFMWTDMAKQYITGEQNQQTQLSNYMSPTSFGIYHFKQIESQYLNRLLINHFFLLFQLTICQLVFFRYECFFDTLFVFQLILRHIFAYKLDITTLATFFTIHFQDIFILIS